MSATEAEVMNAVLAIYGLPEPNMKNNMASVHKILREVAKTKRGRPAADPSYFGRSFFPNHVLTTQADYDAEVKRLGL